MTPYPISLETVAYAIGPERFAVIVSVFLLILGGFIVYSLLKTPPEARK